MRVSAFLIVLVAGLAVGFVIGKRSGVVEHEMDGGVEATLDDAASPADHVSTPERSNTVPAVESSEALDPVETEKWKQRSETIGQTLQRLAGMRDAFAREVAMEVFLERLETGSEGAVFATARELPPGRARMELVLGVLSRWSRSDPAAALVAAGTLPAHERSRALSSVYVAWSEQDPRAAWEAVGRIAPGERHKISAVHGALSRLAKVDASAAITAVNETGNDRIGSTARSSVIASLIEQGEEWDLVSRIGGMETGRARDEWMKSFFQQLAGHDLEQALGMLGQVSDAALAGAATEGFVTGWGQVDALGALDYVVERRDDPVVGRLLGNALSWSVFASGPDEIALVVARVRDQGLLAEAGTGFLSALSQAGFGRTAIELVDAMPAGQERTVAHMQVLSGWMQSDLQAAVSYWNELPGTDVKAQTLPMVARNHLTNGGEPAQVTSWLNGFEGQARTQAATSLVSMLTAMRDRLRVSTHPEIARLIADTPDLPEPVRTRAQAAFGTPPGP